MPAPAGKPTVPVALRDAYDEIVAITDEFCRRHLDKEYAELCAKLAAKLARKRPSPLARGNRRIWAAGAIYAVGRVNFLSDPSQKVHLRTDQLAKLLDVKQATMANKGRLIMDTLKTGHFDPEFSRRDVIDQSPFTWLLEVDGLIMDARSLPTEIQAIAHQKGLIPYVPGQADD